MRKLFLSLIAVIFSLGCYAQSTIVKYYNNEWLQKEVPENRAKYSQTTIQNADGSETKEIRELKNGEIINSETYKGEEPYGIWKYKRSNRVDELDYTFDLKYSDVTCHDSISGIQDYFENNDSLHYTAPKIENDANLLHFIMNHTIYPPVARENGIQGKVYLNFIITKDGRIENITVLKGVHVILDKEAVRVMRQLKLTSPPLINGQETAICVTMPFSFRLM